METNVRYETPEETVRLLKKFEREFLERKLFHEPSLSMAEALNQTLAYLFRKESVKKRNGEVLYLSPAAKATYINRRLIGWENEVGSLHYHRSYMNRSYEYRQSWKAAEAIFQKEYNRLKDKKTHNKATAQAKLLMIKSTSLPLLPDEGLVDREAYYNYFVRVVYRQIGNLKSLRYFLRYAE